MRWIRRDAGTKAGIIGVQGTSAQGVYQILPRF